MDRGTQILLIEDNVADARMIEIMLDDESDQCYRHEHVKTLSEALDIMQEQQFDVILLDLDLPDASGMETITRIREQQSDIPIVIASGMGNEEIVLEAMGKGVHDYLIKGEHDAGELIRVLQLALQKKQQEEQIFHTVHNDNLTGLANRAMFYDSLEKAIGKSLQTNNSTVLLLVDLDQFKELNENLGSHAGDKVIQEVSKRLSSCIENTDTLARLGGDDFALILNDVGNIKEAILVAENVVASLSRKMQVESRQINVGCSVGIAFYPLCKGVSELMYCAEVALYRAKTSGGNRYKLFTDELSKEAAWKYGLETELDTAIEREQFVVHYQPLLDLHTGQTSGVEALLRWQHPKAGLLFPGAFIEQLETSQIGWDVSEWVLMLACRHLKSWQSVGGKELKIDINLSPYQLRDPELVNKVKRALEKTALHAQHIELELTERQIIPEDDMVSSNNVAELREMGIKFALDDYGTGHSSDSYLRRFPGDTISTIKIDRSYIEHITTNPTYASCVKRDIDFAHDLGMRVIAEGIESIEQLEYVREMGADMAQGYLISKAIAAPLVADGIYQGKFDLSEIYSNHQYQAVV